MIKFESSVDSLLLSICPQIDGHLAVPLHANGEIAVEDITRDLNKIEGLKVEADILDHRVAWHIRVSLGDGESTLAAQRRAEEAFTATWYRHTSSTRKGRKIYDD